MPDSTDDAPLSPPVEANPDGAFFLSQADWLSVQCYIETGLRRPIDSAEAVSQLGIHAEDADEFAELWTAYASVHSHCSGFSVNTFPAIVALASDIVDYGRNKAPVFYDAIKTVCGQVTGGELTSDKAGIRIGMVLTNLSADTKARAAKATAAKTALAAFIDASTADQAALKSAKSDIDTKLDGTSGLIQIFQAAVAADLATVRQAQSDYAKDMVLVDVAIACAIVFPFGTIAGAVMLGVYEARAKEARARVEDAMQAFQAANGELVGLQTLSSDMELADHDVDKLLDLLKGATAVLETAESAWLSLSSNLDTMLATLSAEITDPDAFLGKLGVDDAIAAWSGLAETADEFRANAYITVKPAAEITTNDAGVAA